MSRRAVSLGRLVLSDGQVFEGEMLGAPPVDGATSGEVVFNTVLSGYQEVITDPSYAGQIISFTTTHIGNYGVNEFDDEARQPFCRAVVVREMARRTSNHRAERSLDQMLDSAGVCGLGGVDTRRLTRVLRDSGAMTGAIGSLPVAELLEIARREPGTDGVDLVATVTTSKPYVIEAVAGAPERFIVAYDFGIKRTILRHLAHLGRVEVVPAGTSATEVLDRNPDGVFLSNGPGDPAVLGRITAEVSELIGRVPIFGICLGHQILGRALGAGTIKLPFGHHGGNHPVKDLTTGAIEITSQNHNYALDPSTFGGRAVQTHVNLNDGVCEGIEVPGERAFAVQHHPEAGPGPHDSTYLFDRFADLIDRSRRAAS